MQNLVCVDIPESCDEVLIKQQGLDRSRPAPEKARQLRRSRQVIESISTQGRDTRLLQFDRGERNHEAESSGIDKTNLTPANQGHYDVGVRFLDLPRLCNLDAARHSEVGNPGDITFDSSKHELPDAIQSSNTPSGQSGCKVSRLLLAAHHPIPSHIYISDSGPNENRLEVTPGRLYLRELRHLPLGEPPAPRERPLAQPASSKSRCRHPEPTLPR